MTSLQDRPLVASAQTAATRWAVTDPHRVAVERYYDREFFELEKNKLWTKTWLMACREQEIPKPGDFTEFEIVDQTILLVRQRDNGVRALFNACRHRGTTLAEGAGHLGGGLLVCPFHGWKWNIDGSPASIVGDYGFRPECVKQEEVALRECQVEIWGGCVWINMDPAAAPLEEFLGEIAPQLTAVGMENWKLHYWKEAIVDCNWKVAGEAFMEGWHVPQTHPQLAFNTPPEQYPMDSQQYDVFPGGHSRFLNNPGEVSEPTPADVYLQIVRQLFDGQDAMMLERDINLFESLRDKVPPTEDFAIASAQGLLQYYKDNNIPHPENAMEQPLWWSGEVFIFPNVFFLPSFGNCLAYRFRPHGDDPEKCRAEVWSLTTYAEEDPQPRAKLTGRFATDDTENWGLIPRQDFSNVSRIQRGLHSRGMSEIRLATRWEKAISHMHMELDRYLTAE